jgi:PAS domain S-box-containing protein
MANSEKPRSRRDLADPADYLQIAQVAIVALDDRGRVALINRKGCEILGATADEIQGRDWFDTFIPGRMREDLRRVYGQLMRGEVEPVETYENPVVTFDGEERLIAWHNAVLRDERGRIIGTVSSGEDVTAKREVEERLARSHRELEDIRNALDQAAIVAITDQAGIIHYVNDKFCEISKYSRDELIGRDHRIVNSGYHPREFIRGLWRTIARGEVWRGEIRNRAKGGTLYWVDTTIVPLLDERGKPNQYLAIRSDITDRKLAEESLREQEALAKLGQMAAVVAHEVKNPLAGIGGALQVIRGRLPDEGGDHQIIDSILERLDMLNERVQDLLRFSRPRTPRFAPLQLKPLLADTLSLVERDPRLHAVDVELHGDDVSMSADAEMLIDLFSNLILNAAQAMDGGGRVRVSLRAINGVCEVVVADHGPGIPEKARARIFEPFFTTKSQGTGLGLAIARRAVEAHAGRIDVDSPAAGGTAVTVELPLVREPEAGSTE